MTQESSSKSEQESEIAWRGWRRLVEDDHFRLFQQVLTNYRWQLLELLVRVGSDHEKAAEKRGAILMIDHILAGGLDEQARELLGLSEEPARPVQPYMPEEEL